MMPSDEPNAFAMRITPDDVNKWHRIGLRMEIHNGGVVLMTFYALIFDCA